MEYKTDHWPALDKTVLFYLTNIPVESWTPNDWLKYAYLHMRNHPGDGVFFGILTLNLEKHTGAVVGYELWIGSYALLTDRTGVYRAYPRHFSVN